MDSEPAYDALAAYYDILYSGLAPADLSFYSALSKEHESPVLELGCGTGRLTIPLAESGIDITGLELSPAMLARAESKLQECARETQQRCTLLLGDMRCFDLDRRFGLIILAYSSLLELGSERDRHETLDRCRQHLDDDGALVIDNFFRGDGKYANWGRRRPDHTMLYLGTYSDPTDPAGCIQHFEVHSFDPDSATMLGTVFVDHVAPSGVVRRDTIALRRQYVSPEAMEDELKQARFLQVSAYGGLNREPLYDPALEGRGRQVFVAKP